MRKAARAMAAARTALADTSKDGAFERKDALFRKWVGRDGEHPVESGRYHLYISYACPWANRTLMTGYLKNIVPNHVGLSVVHPTWQRTRPDDADDEHCGWAFANADDPPFHTPNGSGSFPRDEGCTADDVNGAKYVRDLYDISLSKLPEDEQQKCKLTRFTVPILWDKKLGVIVSNESSEIIRMFNAEFNSLDGVNAELDLYPEALRAKVDAANEWIYPSINNGVYRCGFATKQGAYEEACNELFGALDRLEGILAKTPYVCGDQLTEADVRLIPTLTRFDDVYVVYFKTNKRLIREYPAILNYVRRCLQEHEAIRRSIDHKHCVTHYFTSHPVLNTHGIVPLGAGLAPFLDTPYVWPLEA